ncbi:MAG: ATP-dependent zinc metalloprotease FtsH [Planctomycetota bacterium]|nr:ATP-dependent zinc metalloprotease FtsH [Planctomycetota bacterium]MDI6787036.1 ATP-dependent zinc metalloprotease FtsH [Planctomycetota bacterium]
MKNTFLLLFILALLIISIFYAYKTSAEKKAYLTFAQFYEEAKDGKIKTIFITGTKIDGEYKPGETHKYYKIIDEVPKESISKVYDELKSVVSAKDIRFSSGDNFWYQVFFAILPVLLIVGVIWFFIIRQVKGIGGPGGPLAFGKSKARLIGKDKRKTTFNDVAGIEESKEEVKEIIEFLRDPLKFRKLGARIPRGVLLIGPPGSGKTLLAKAIAGEADVPFFTMSGSDFVEMFVGVGASRVRDLFNTAKENSPCIIFLDEIDAVGRQRGTGLGGGHDEREQTLNAILVEMDGFDTDSSVIIMAATNRPDVLDSALLRPGRFDRQIVIDLPDVKGREAILKVHARKIKINPAVDLGTLAKTTPMLSGADLEAIINESALLAVMRKKPTVTMEELEEARDKVRWGREKRSREIDETDRKITAYHESGHALASYLIPEVENVHKVTIISRGGFLGATMRLPEKDRYHMQKKYILGNITVLYSGRVAEELFCQDISAGARSDIREATKLARFMVCEWGMSEKLGPISYTEQEEHLFLGREITKTKSISDDTAKKIDEEIKNILFSCLQRARELITQNKDVCDRLARALLKHEVLTGQDVENVIKGMDIDTLKNKEVGEEVRPPA